MDIEAVLLLRFECELGTARSYFMEVMSVRIIESRQF